MDHAAEREPLIARAVEAGQRQGCADPGLRGFLDRYFRHVAAEDLRERDPVDLAGLALSHRQLAAERPPGTARVRAFTPTVDEHGWATGHSVIEVVTDDMPFLVDSVNAQFTQRHRTVHLLVHPQLAVRRDGDGTLLEVLDLPVSRQLRDRLPADALVESWIHLEIDREPDPAELAEIAAALRGVLQDVRAAVEDWPLMHEQARELADELAAAAPPGIPADDAAEAAELLRWLTDEHFTFLGYREYRLTTVDAEGDGDALVATPGSGLGILRQDQHAASESFSRLAAPVRAKAREKRLLVLTKANSRATVHRPAYLDYIGVKTFDESGEVTGERRFLGLFSSAAYIDSVLRVPVVSRKVAAVLERAGLDLDSHSGKDLLQILETYPRDELFQIGVDDLARIATAAMHLQVRRRTRLFVRPDEYGRFISCLVYLPRDRYTTPVRLRIEDLLRRAYSARSVDYTTRVSESPLARLHFVVRVDPTAPLPSVDLVELEARIVDAVRGWEEDLVEALRADAGEEEAARLHAVWQRAFPEAYKETFPARVAVADVAHLEALDPDDASAIGLNLYEPVGAGALDRRFKVYRWHPVALTRVLPYLSDLGVDVIDERPYELLLADGRRAYIYDFGLRYPVAPDTAPERGRAQFTEAFQAAWSGRADSDGFGRLVLLGGLDWRQVGVLRGYAKYLRQAGTTFSQEYLQGCLAANVDLARQLTRLFETRFDPDRFGAAEPDGRAAPARAEAAEAQAAEIIAGLEQVASLDHDRILRALLGLIMATQRTNAFAPSAEDYLAFKLDPRRITELPEPRPQFEIFVYSPRLEGVHLRFGPVARGGLRWSDRREDFRTEVLGLVKAQMVKNAVIVPTGAKGGFVAKRLPDPGADRDGWLTEGLACYTQFISALLDLTDNLGPDQQVLPPRRVVRHDGDDPYLVVAADKGTARFSDTANAVSQRYGFWLGDAFASGGSAGYDHKAMGITARGAWESVRQHFRELGRDVQREDFTVVGIGDMSGDVFGNGMLLSRHIRLVAAFDHRHIFLDPDPDPERSFEERERLFGLAGSSWADYDSALISPGGGVYPRTAKSIPITPQVADRLGMAQPPAALSPAELLREILTAPVDLLWNGGIGTYVKASGESHGDVGDKANDAIRVDGRRLRAKVVGEGGNLGFTQPGRIEAALRGVRLNTDAIDNSAGVDCSDREVNIKILLDQVVATGDLTGKQRNQLLAEMTEDVAQAVLRDNYRQNVLLATGRAQAHSMLTVHQRLLRWLEGRGLDRALEHLPDDETLAERDEQGTGLTSPELAVLAAHVKITLAEDLAASGVPDDPALEPLLRRYFPPPLVDRFSDRLPGHRLRRQIITNVLANDLVDTAGISAAFRILEELGAGAESMARAYMVCRQVFDAEGFLAEVESLDGRVPVDAQIGLYLELRRLLDRSMRWLLQNRPAELAIGEEIARFGPVIADLGGLMPKLLRGAEHKALIETAEGWTAQGVPEPLALRAAGALSVFQLLDITEISVEAEALAAEVAEVYFALSERYGADALLERISALSRADRWRALARGGLRYDLYGALGALTRAVIADSERPAEGGRWSADAGRSANARIEAWEQGNAPAVERVRARLEELRRVERPDLAVLSVALRTLRSVVRGG